MKTRTLALFAIPALASTMGATNCQYFSKVTVPAVDTQKPLFATRFFFDGEEELEFVPIEYETDDLEATFVAYPAIYDSGGARNLTVVQSLQVRCKNSSSGVPTTGVDIHYVPLFAQQAGSVGSSVSNGIYLSGMAMSFSQHTHYCSGTNVVDEIEYTWAMSGEDFAGNSDSVFGGSVVYIP